MLDKLNRDTTLLAAAADGTATALRKCAAETEAAAHRHHSMLHRMLVAGAMVVVGGAAIAVTYGAASVLVAATVEAAATAATAAAEAALAAGESAAAELASLERIFAGVRGLVAFGGSAAIRFELAETCNIAWNQLTTGHFGFDLSLEHHDQSSVLSSMIGGGAGALVGQGVASAPLAVRIGVPSLVSGVTGAAVSDGYTRLQTGEGGTWSFVRDTAAGSIGAALGHKESGLHFTFEEDNAPATP